MQDSSKGSQNVKAEPKSSKSEGSCFAIMPFGGWFDKYYSDIYCPAIESAKLEPKRADDLFRPGTIINDIWDYTKEAKVILADLTGKNANVLYELGLAHAIAKPVIILTETMEDIPFDLRALRVIEYDKNAPDWGEILKKKIVKSIKELLKSPMKSVLPAFLEVDESVEKKKITPHEKEIISIKQELDALRREARRKSISPREKELEPEDAAALIEAYLDENMPENEIIEKLSPLGPPPRWTLDKIKEIKKIRDESIPF